MSSNNKGSMAEVKTFEKYKIKDLLGMKIEEKDGKRMMTFIWCKLCGKHKDVILSNPLCKGCAKVAIETCFKGTNFLKKCTIDRDFEGEYPSIN